LVSDSSNDVVIHGISTVTRHADNFRQAENAKYLVAQYISLRLVRVLLEVIPDFFTISMTPCEWFSHDRAQDYLNPDATVIPY
jgi:hypothetical protein